MKKNLPAGVPVPEQSCFHPILMTHESKVFECHPRMLPALVSEEGGE